MSMVDRREFQFIFTAADYRATVEFYGEGLGLPVIDSWSRGPNDQGTKFRASSGTIVVMALPVSLGYTLGKTRLPQGVSMGLEVDNVDAWHQRALEKQLPISQELTSFTWGERGFSVSDPNGIEVYIFSISR